MKLQHIPIGLLREAPFNPNRMEPEMEEHLRFSLRRFGMVQNLVVRPSGDASFEVLSGNQRLRILRSEGLEDVPCIVVSADDVEARLLAQALNRIQGEDDLGLKAELIQKVLDSVGADEVLSVLPETAESLAALESLGDMDLGEHLEVWDRAQAAKLRRMNFQLSNDQVSVVEDAMESVIAGLDRDSAPENPNRRGNALFHLCRAYLESKGEMS